MKVQKTLHTYFKQSNNNSVIDLFIKDLKQLFFCLDVSKDGITFFFLISNSVIHKCYVGKELENFFDMNNPWDWNVANKTIRFLMQIVNTIVPYKESTIIICNSYHKFLSPCFFAWLTNNRKMHCTVHIDYCYITKI